MCSLLVTLSFTHIGKHTQMHMCAHKHKHCCCSVKLQSALKKDYTRHKKKKGHNKLNINAWCVVVKVIWLWGLSEKSKCDLIKRVSYSDRRSNSGKFGLEEQCTLL